MTKEKVKNAINLTKECLDRYWQKDYKFVVNHICDDATWIGANQCQFMQGKNEIEKDFEQVNKEIKNCHLSNYEFYAADNSKNCCTVVGRYLVTTDENQDVFLQVQQRCVFVWIVFENELKIKVINVSNPIGELKLAERELFPNNVGKMVLKKFNSELDKYRKNTKKLTFYDVKGRLTILDVNEIEYAESAERNVIIYTNEETVVVREKWGDFLLKVKDYLIQVHRSYVVNVNSLSIVDKREIILKNGAIIPIPYKKRKEIREMIERIYKTE